MASVILSRLRVCKCLHEKTFLEHNYEAVLCAAGLVLCSLNVFIKVSRVSQCTQYDDPLFC